LTPTHAEVVTLAAAAVPLPLSPQATKLSESSKGNSSSNSQRRLSHSGSKQRRNSATSASTSSSSGKQSSIQPTQYPDDTHDYDGIHQQ
jgi:hypothetical protein